MDQQNYWKKNSSNGGISNHDKYVENKKNNHSDILESVKKLAAASKQPLVVINGNGDVLSVNELGEEALKKKGRSLMVRKFFSFFNPVWYLAYNNNFYEIESIADFRTKDGTLHICRIRT